LRKSEINAKNLAKRSENPLKTNHVSH